MKVYQIARKVDGFGNDMCTILNEVYLDKNMAKIPHQHHNIYFYKRKQRA